MGSLFISLQAHAAILVRESEECLLGYFLPYLRSAPGGKCDFFAQLSPMDSPVEGVDGRQHLATTTFR